MTAQDLPQMEEGRGEAAQGRGAVKLCSLWFVMQMPE